MAIAESDLATAIYLSQSESIRKETTLFNVEQAVEKAIKAVLCHLEKPVPLTHDLYAVIQALPQNNLPPGEYGLHDLTPYATVRRYEDAVDVLTNADIKIALQSAREVLDWAKQILG